MVKRVPCAALLRGFLSVCVAEMAQWGGKDSWPSLSREKVDCGYVFK